jgi:hypothetical protein
MNHVIRGTNRTPDILQGDNHKTPGILQGGYHERPDILQGCNQIALMCFTLVIRENLYIIRIVNKWEIPGKKEPW